eukprot:gene16264-7647_t
MEKRRLEANQEVFEKPTAGFISEDWGEDSDAAQQYTYVPALDDAVYLTTKKLEMYTKFEAQTKADMASDSETDEFYDASEELSPLKEAHKKEKNVSSEVQKETIDVPKQPPSSKGSGDMVAKDTNLSLVSAPAQDPVKDPSDASPPKAEPLKTENGEAAKGSPVPVAPPRKKRQQKKEALAKSQDQTAPPKPPPPRPKSQPKLIKEPASKPEPTESQSPTTANHPCITVNSDAKDMNEVLIKGSASDIVKNQDLDEFKSPAGSKTSLEKSNDGSTTPLRASLGNLKIPGAAKLQEEIVRSTSSSGRPLSDIEILEQVIVKNLDTGETVPLSLAEDKLPKCVNPMSLQIMRLTSEYEGDTASIAASEDGNLSDTSIAPSVKTERKGKKLKQLWGKTVEKIKSVADEVKALRDESSSSDEDENQDSHYIKRKTHKAIRDKRAFEKIHLLQDLSGEQVAAAGQDNIVRVWVLKEAQSFFDEMRAKYAKTERGSPTSSIASINSITSFEDDNTLEEDALSKDEDFDDTGPFRKAPFCTYHGHTSDVLDLSWSKTELEDKMGRYGFETRYSSVSTVLWLTAQG